MSPGARPARRRPPALLVAFAACVALLGAAAWWLFVRRPIESPEIGSAAVVPAAATVEAAPESSAVALEAPAAGARAPARVERSKSNARAAATPKGPPLRIVDAGSGKPLAAAEVTMIELGRAGIRDPGDFCVNVELAEKRGTRSTCDAQGVTSFPRPKGMYFVVAWTRDRWGAGWVAPELGPVEFERVGNAGGFGPRTKSRSPEIALHVDGAIEVLAHGADDRPVASAPLAIAEYDAQHKVLLRRAKATSDERGRATFAHGRAWIERASPARPLLVVDGAFPRVLQRELTPDDFGKLVPIEVPPLGSVVVRVLDFEGEPVKRGAPVELVGQDLVLPFASDLRRETAGGSVTFPAVAAGVEARFEARLPYRKQLVGPIPGSVTLGRAGERAELVLGGPTSVPVLVLRALDEARAPLAATAIEVQLEAPAPRGFDGLMSPVRSDANGVVRVFLPGWREDGGALRLVAPPAGERKIVTAVVAVPRGLEAGERELGDVVLAALPLLAAGRVVDQLGRPIENANVDVLARGPDGASWIDVSAHALTDREGTFAIDASPEGELGIRASASHCKGTNRVQPLARGSTGLELELERLASIQGTALIDPGLAPPEINLVWHATSPSGEAQQFTLVGAAAEDRGDGLARAAFRQDNLTAGVGKLEARAVSSSLLVLEPFELLPGPNPDALQDLDLRGLVRVFHLTILDRQGGAIPAGQIHFRASGSDDPWQLWSFRDGRARLLALAPELDLSVFGAPGRTTAFERVRGDAELVLDGPIWTRIALEGGNPVRAPDLLGLVFTLVEERGSSVVPVLKGPLSVVADPAGRTRLAFATPGRYAVEFRVTCGARGTSAAVPERAELEIESSADEREYTLVPPRDTIASVLEALLAAPGRGAR